MEQTGSERKCSGSLASGDCIAEKSLRNSQHRLMPCAGERRDEAVRGNNPDAAVAAVAHIRVALMVRRNSTRVAESVYRWGWSQCL